MDSAQRWASSSSRPPTDPIYQRIFDAYLYEYLLKRNLLASAKIFKQEAQVEDLRNMLLTDSPGDFLFDWWAIFYEKYIARLGQQRNQTALFSQVGQGSSNYDLPPLPPFFPDPGTIPLVHGSDYIPQARKTPDGSPLIYRTSGINHALSAPNGSRSPLVTGTGDIPPAWLVLDSPVVPATEQAPMPSVDLNLGFQSPSPSSAVVLTPRNLTSDSSTQCRQPRPTRRGIRRGSTPYDPVYVEAPMASPASAPKGPSSSASIACRPRCENLPSSRGSSLIGACRMPEPASLPSPGSLSMSRAWMVGQLAHYSRPSLFTALRANSVLTLTANFNAVSGSLLTSSLGVGGQGERYGPLPSNYLAMLASTSSLNSDAHDASNDYNSNPLFTAAVGLSAVGASATINSSSSSQEMASEKSSNGVKPETVGQPSTPATASNLQTDIKMETNEEVSSAAKESNMKEAGVEELQQKENDTDVGDYLNDNNGYENEVYSYAFMSATQQLEVPQMQPQPSHSVEVRDEGFEFKLEACLESNLVELWCCHFSSTGKYLACAGIDRKVIVWNMGTFVYTVSEEHHQEAIVDIRFKSNSSIFASASLDTTIRIWDANEPERSLVHLTGHTASVTSVDFHPTHVDLLCSCDGNKEIRLWNISNGTCLHVIKGASQQARFQAQKGIYLAAVAGNTINILDTETLTIVHTLEGHIQPVECLCWDPSGRYLASASQESIHIWSVSSLPNSMHKLTAESGSKFKSCVFHPRTTHVVIISSDKNIEIWNPMGSGKTVVVPAHDSYVAGLTSSICTDMIASVGKDCHVKLWK